MQTAVEDCRLVLSNEITFSFETRYKNAYKEI